MQEIYKVKNLILVLRKNLRNYHLNLGLEKKGLFGLKSKYLYYKNVRI